MGTKVQIIVVIKCIWEQIGDPTCAEKAMTPTEMARVEPMAMMTAGVLYIEATVPTMYERLTVITP